jgi:hypothetical protein
MLHALADARATAVPVPRGDDGLDLDRLAELARRGPAMLYLLPTFHNPTGRTLDAAQRRALVEVAVAHDLPGVRGRPVRPRADRRRAAADDLDAAAGGGPGRPRDLRRVVLEDGRAGAAGRLSGAAGAPRRGPLDGRLAHLRVAADAAAGAAARVPLRLGTSSRTWQPWACSCARAGTRSSRRSTGSADAIRFTRPGGGYFLWLELPDHVDATELERPGDAPRA